MFLVTTILCMAAGVGLGSFHGTGAWMAVQILNGLGTSAYQAVIQLSVSRQHADNSFNTRRADAYLQIFDMFFVHDRGTMLSVYLFGQQLGSMYISRLSSLSFRA